MVMEGDSTWGGEHTIQCTDDMLQNCTPEAYIILSINVTPISSIKVFFKDEEEYFKVILHLKRPTQEAQSHRPRMRCQGGHAGSRPEKLSRPRHTLQFYYLLSVLDVTPHQRPYLRHLYCKHCTWPEETGEGQDSQCIYVSHLLLQPCIRSATQIVQKRKFINFVLVVVTNTIPHYFYC